MIMADSFKTDKLVIGRKSTIFPPRVLNAHDEGVPLGIWFRRKGS